MPVWTELLLLFLLLGSLALLLEETLYMEIGMTMASVWAFGFLLELIATTERLSEETYSALPKKPSE
ncbi:MAG: hypothetical protein GWN86_10295 [Desulfobacterales bacterium]|nr:hypothetical protein [Desulfobacterales bacterium]